MALIPANRRPYGSWVLGTNVGVVGGVPNRTTIFDDNGSGITASLDSIDNTGATDVSAAIQAALDSCISGQVVRLPDGIFRIDSTLNLPATFNGKSFRGSGMGLTTIKSYVNQAIIIGSGSGYFIPDPPVTVTAGATAGSTAITCDGDISYLAANSIIKLTFANELDPLMYSVYGFDVNTNTSPFNQVVRVTGKSGQDLSIFPPLCATPVGEVRVITQSFSARDIGLENMTVDSQEYTGGPGGSFSGVAMQQCANSWIKNVESINAWNYGIIIAECVTCSMTGCWSGELKGEFSNGAGLLFAGWNCHVEDNVITDAFPGLEANAGSMGNVFDYNFSDGQWNTNHAPHNRFNLHEGNAVNHHMSDGYFGSESDLTHFRCLFYAGTSNLRRFTRNVSIIGCITQLEIGCGLPNIGNVYYDGECQLSLGDPWRDYGMEGTLSDRIDDTHGEITVTTGGFLAYDGISLHRVYLYYGTNNENVLIGNVTAWSNPVSTIELISGTYPVEGTEFTVIGPGSYGDVIPEESTFQELDLDVFATLVDKLTYRVDNDTLSSGGGDTLYDSEIYASTPDWWPVGMAWPPIDPEDPVVTGLYTRVPAGLRFSESVPDEAPEITTPCTVTGTPIQGQILTAVPGTATGNPPPTRTWKWQRDGVDIVGATSITYLLTGGDVGFDVGPVQIETNSEGFDESVATPLTILAFQGDILLVTQVANTDPVTELWLRGALTAGVSAPLEYYLVQHSGPYPTQPDNNFVYARFGTPQDNVYVFQGTISEAEAIASVP